MSEPEAQPESSGVPESIDVALEESDEFDGLEPGAPESPPPSARDNVVTDLRAMFAHGDVATDALVADLRSGAPDPYWDDLIELRAQMGIDPHAVPADASPSQIEEATYYLEQLRQLRDDRDRRLRVS